MRSRLPLSMRMRKVGNYAPPTPGGPAAFDPTDVGFSHVYWTGGTEFTALGLSDTDAVSSWPDEVGTADLAQATGTKQPVLDATYSPLNDQPAVSADGTDDFLGTGASAWSLTGPYSIVFIAAKDDFNQERYLYGNDGSGSNVRCYWDNTPTGWTPGSSGTWMGLSEFSGTLAEGNMVIWEYAGANLPMRAQCFGSSTEGGGERDPLVTGSNDTWSSMKLFSNNGGLSNNTASCAFFGIYDGYVTEDPNYYNFLDWVYDTYAIDARPPSLVGWAHSYWTSGPEFEALGLSDGAAVSSWPDEQNVDDYAQGTGTKQPSLDDDAINSLPAVVFGGTDDSLDIAAWTSGNKTQPYTRVVLGYLSGSTDYENFVDGSSASNRAILGSSTTASGVYRQYAGSTRSGGTVDTDPHLLVSLFDGASSETEADGTSIISGNSGSNVLEGSRMGSDHLGSSQFLTGGVAFEGFFDGDVRTDPYWEQAESYLRWKYGLFDPINDVAWDAAYWTEGTEFTALGLSDTDAVGTWPDEVGTNDLVQATGTKQPTLDVDGAPNGNPQLVFDGTDDLYEATSALSLTQPWSAVMIGQVRYQGGVTRRMWTAANGGFANGLYSTVSDHAVYCGATLTGTGSDNADHLFVTVLNGTSSDLKIDTVLSEGDAGTQGVNTKHVVGAQNTSGSSIAPLDCCFFAIYDGDVTADPGWPFFLQWVEQHYNLTQFDPVGDVGWSHAYWTEGAEFLAQGYADTDAVSSWPDEVGTADLAQATGSKQPIYDADGGPNSTPSVYFDETDDFLTEATASVSQGLTIVMIGQMLTTPNDGANHMIGGATVTRPLLHYDTSGNNWFWYAGTNTNTGVAHDTDNHLHVAYFDGASSKWDIDGTQIDAANVGTDNLSGITMGAQYDGAGSYSDVDVSFAAVFDGDVTTDPNWQRFLDWAREHYGLPVAIG